MVQNLKEQDTILSKYKYNPLDLRNWVLLCKIVVGTSIFLIIDWILGLNSNTDSIQYSFLASNFPDNVFLINILPLIVAISFLALSPIINNDFDDISSFLGTILIKFLLYLSSCQYTIIGEITRWILNFSCSVLIIVVIVMMLLFNNQEPLTSIQTMILVSFFILGHLLFNLVMNGWTITISEMWGICFLIVIGIASYLIHIEKILFGALPVFIMYE